MYDRQATKILHAWSCLVCGLSLVVLLGCNKPGQPDSSLPAVIPPTTTRTNRALNIPFPVVQSQTIVVAERASVENAMSVTLVPSATNLSASGFTGFVEAPASTPSLGSVSLKWDASRDTTVVSYRVYYGTNSTVFGFSATVGNSTKVKITGLIEDRVYYFACVAIDHQGLESPFSNIVAYRVPITISARFDRMVIEGYGVFGRTNYFQMTTNLVNWSDVASFVGDGQIKQYFHTPSLIKAQFRIRSE